MNTINVYLTTSGSISRVQKDFALFVGSYQNKLIDVYVPVSILYENQEHTFNNAVKIAGKLTADNGDEITTDPYYLSYIHRTRINNVDYAVFERILPKELTVYAGEQTIIVNVVSIDRTMQPARVLEITTSQQFNLLVEASAYAGDDVQDPTVFEEYEARLTSAEQEISDIDDVLQMTVNEEEQPASQRLDLLDNQVEDNTNDISDIQDILAQLSNYIGEIDVDTLVGINLVLDEYVLSVAGRPRQNGDTVIVNLNSEDDDLIGVYKYIFTLSGWQGYPIGIVNKASNITQGTIQGTYGASDENPVKANVQAGKIIDIYYKKTNGNYASITPIINELDYWDQEIRYGGIYVPRATNAVNDQNGDNIVNTYAKASNVYTKTQSDAKYMPKTYTNVYYYATDGLVDDLPTTPVSGIQFTANIANVGETQLFSCSKTLENAYNFNKNSNDKSNLWLFTDTNCKLQFRLVTQITKNGVTTLLASELSNELDFVAQTPQEVKFDTLYSQLGSVEYNAEIGDIFTKNLFVIPADNTATELNLYSNSTYPSTFNLNAQSIDFNLNIISGLARVGISIADWASNGNGTYSTTILQTTHKQPPSPDYLLELRETVSANTYRYVAFEPIIDDDGNITLTTAYPLYCVLLIGSGLIGEGGKTEISYYSNNAITLPANTTYNVDIRQNVIYNEDFGLSTSGVYGVTSPYSENIVKLSIEFTTAAAPSSGNITINVAGQTETITYAPAEVFSQIIRGYYFTNQNFIPVILSSTFTTDVQISNIEISIICPSVNKVTTSDNAFDIKTGTRWNIDYTNHTITQKQ